MRGAGAVGCEDACQAGKVGVARARKKITLGSKVHVRLFLLGLQRLRRYVLVLAQVLALKCLDRQMAIYLGTYLNVGKYVP